MRTEVSFVVIVDSINKAHIEHAVSLIQYQCLQGIEFDSLSL
nr:hypothetical protein [uncultured Moellerella sp.]